jgi:hypothetical protein
VLLQEVACDFRGGHDNRGDCPQAEGHERAVELREARKGAVRLVTEEVEVADKRTEGEAPVGGRGVDVLGDQGSRRQGGRR